MRRYAFACKLALGFLGVLASGLLFAPHDATLHAESPEQVGGFPHDWSHHHMVYSAPQSSYHALLLSHDPRYLQQWYSRNADLFRVLRRRPVHPTREQSSLANDWSEIIGSNPAPALGTAGAGNYPAKYSFNLTTANCATAAQPDYTVYNTSVAPLAAQTAATATVTFTAEPAAGNTITAGATTYTFHTTTAFCGTTPCIIRSATLASDAANLEAALNDNAAQCGTAAPCFANITTANASVSATAAGAVTTLTSKTVGTAGDFTVTANFAGVTIAGGNNGMNVQASLIAYDNLYSGCTGTVPQIYWAYDTGGTISTSVILSLDGSQVAFIHTAATGASLVILKWKAGEGGTYNANNVAPATPTTSTTTPATYATCRSSGTSCMLTLAFANAANDSNSYPFLDYASDVLYVGDDTGHIHKFTGVFKGTPAEVGNPWVTLTHSGAGDLASSPVYDSTSGRVIIGDEAGYLYNVACTSGGNPASCSLAGVTTTLNTSAQISTGGNGVFEGPMVDGTAQQVYAFVSHDTGVGAAQRAGVFQFPVTFASGAAATSEAKVSTNNTLPTSLFGGDFDNTYFSSDKGSAGANQPSGNLYVCGVAAGIPTLFQIPITQSAVGTPVQLQSVATAAASVCGPITEAYNVNETGGAEDWIFLSVTASSSQNGTYGCAAAGCLMNLAILEWQASTAYAAGQHIIDSNGDTEVVTGAGTSKSGAHPTWSTAGNSTTDGTVTWLNQGPAGTYASWRNATAFAAGTFILDDKGYIQEVTTAGTSGAAQPNWTETTGTTTADNTVTWTNRGPAGAATLAASAGASGVIIDNYVSAGVLAGTAQIYFTPLGSGTCATSGGTGGCAVQASQAGLQ